MSEQIPIVPAYPHQRIDSFWPEDLPVTKSASQYSVDKTDALFSLVMLVFGFLAWNWIWPRIGRSSIFFPGISVTLLFILLIACSLTYFKVRGVVLKMPAVGGALLILLVALPFAIYNTTPVHFFAGMALVAGYITWHAIAAGTAIAPRLDGMTAADLLNQAFVIPTLNAGSWFSAARQMIRERRNSSRLVFGVIGVVVSLPIIVAVLLLLMQSDLNFNSWMSGFVQSLAHINLWHFIWQIILGVPIAIYLFALLYGNAHKRRTNVMTSEGVEKYGATIRKVPVVAIVSPMAILCLIYVVFFAAMGSYLLSALWHKLPAQFTYAEYARRGFFELAAVAAIDLGVLFFAYWFAARGKREYPVSLRILGGAICGLTLMLIVTDISKMVLYIDQFGLSRLRLYTLWFMVVMFVVFALIGARHVKQFKVGAPVAVVVLFAFLALLWANSDAIIAQYNVNRALNGTSSSIDVDYLANDLGAAAVPALTKLANDAPDPAVRGEATRALASMRKNGTTTGAPWTSWTWQSFRAGQLLGR
ncbi:MAG: DUF4173 domain-containing protein [Propionibacteriaceae bacterium]|nr:DUF4173 domain-containing protein [Propionibacteriaceae bacterium]